MHEGSKQRVRVGSAGNEERKRTPLLAEEVPLDVNRCYLLNCARFRAPTARVPRPFLSQASSLISMMHFKVSMSKTMARNPVSKGCKQAQR